MQSRKPKPTEQGLTLIESLAAMVILTIAIVSISPPIMLSMASRIRAHRAQEAMKLAQGEIDRVRLLVEQGTPDPNRMPPDVGAVQPRQAPVTGTPTESCKNNLTAQWCHVDLDNDGSWDMAIQRFRTYTRTAGQNNVPVAFCLGARVYTRPSMDAGNLQNPPSKTASLALGSGTQLNLPMAAVYVPIVKSDLARASFGVYEDFLTVSDGCR